MRKLTVKEYRQWILGLLMTELNVEFTDMEKIKHLNHVATEITGFGITQGLLTNETTF